MANVALLTILPTPSQGTRYIQQDLVDWIQAAGHHVTARKKFFINVTFAESSLDAESEFRAALMSIGRDAEVLLMDMSYSTDLGRFYGHFDMLAAEALATCNFEIAILLFDAAPWRDDAITNLASLTNHNPEIAVHALSAGWLVPNRFTLDLAAPPKSNQTHSLDEFANFTVRQRGVFGARHSESAPYAFYYSIPRHEHRERLTSVIVDYFTAEGVAAVIQDSGATGEWFKSAVAAACSRLKIPWVDGLPHYPDAHQSEEQATQLARIEGILRDGSPAVAVAVPALRSGVLPGRAARWIAARTSETPRIMTVFLDYGTDPEPPGMSLGRVLRRRRRRLADGSSRDVDYFIPASLATANGTPWKQMAANMMDQVRPTSSADIRIDDVGAWSLLEEYGAAIEGATPPDRDPLRHYPKLQDLDNWDARWLSTIAIDLAAERLDALPEEMAFFFPEEETPNGAARLHESLRSVMGVESFMIPRRVFEGRELLESAFAEELRYRSQGKKAIVFDEAAVTHGTLTKLSAYLLRAFRIRTQLSMVVADLSGQPTSVSNVLSLMKWRPMVSARRS